MKLSKWILKHGKEVVYIKSVKKVVKYYDCKYPKLETLNANLTTAANIERIDNMIFFYSLIKKNKIKPKSFERQTQWYFNSNADINLTLISIINRSVYQSDKHKGEIIF